MPVIELFNFYYFLYIFIAILITVLAVKFLKNKSQKFIHYFIFALIMLNFSIHFLKIFIYPYTLVDHIWTKVSFENICAVSVLLFPFLYFTKNKTLKDYMVMVGMASGILTFIAPIDAMSSIFNGTIFIGPRSAFMLENIRFYTAHFLLFLIPFLMMHFKMHELSVRRAYRAPFVLMAVLFIIFINELIITFLGWVPKIDLFNPEKRNPSLIFGSKSQFSGIGLVIGVLVPSFFILTHPLYEFTFYLPVLWLIIPVMIYGGAMVLLFCFIYDKDDTKLFFQEKLKLQPPKIEESKKV